MKETVKGLKKDLRRMKKKLIMHFIKKLLGVKKLRDPIDVLWCMIDEENSSGSAQDEYGNPAPWCVKIDAWLEAIDRISRECFGGDGARERN